MANKNTEIVSIESKIFTIRGIKVMIDSDLAVLYGASTGALNQAIVSVLSKLIYKSSKLLLLCVVMRWLKSRKTLPIELVSWKRPFFNIWTETING